MRYTTKRVNLDAIQYDGKNFAQVSEFCGGRAVWDMEFLSLVEGAFHYDVFEGDYIVRDAMNNYFVMHKSDFEATYEPIGTEESS